MGPRSPSWPYYDYVAEINYAIKRNDLDKLREILGRMRLYNVGEAYIEGLKEAANKARERLASE